MSEGLQLPENIDDWTDEQWAEWEAQEEIKHAEYRERVYDAMLRATELGGYWMFDAHHGLDEIIFYANDDAERQLLRDQWYQPDERRYNPTGANPELSEIRYETQQCLEELADEGRIVPFFRSGWPGYCRPGREAWAARVTHPERKKAGNIPPKLRPQVWEKSNGRCWYCGTALNPFTNFSVDHLVPRADGGTNDLFNLVPCCSSCNSAKGTRSIEEFRAWMPGSIFWFEDQGLS